jgi:hypothetical protein
MNRISGVAGTNTEHDEVISKRASSAKQREKRSSSGKW